MADFENGYHVLTECNYDNIQGILETQTTPINCDFAVLFTSLSAIDFGRAVYLMASNSENFYLSCHNIAQDNQGGQDEETVKFGEITNAASNTHVTSATNGGDLLELANTYKDLYFNGQTQTAATLKAFLDEKYGTHTYYYSSLGLLPISRWLSGANPGYRRKIILSADVTSPLYDEPTYDPSAATNPSWEFTGSSITYPGTLPPSTQEPDDKPAFRAWWIFEEHNETTELQFDVWIDGTQDPNIQITHKALSVASNFSLQTCSPIVWPCPTITIGQAQTVDDGGIYVPNEANTYMRKYASTWPGKYASPYLTQVEACASEASTAARIAQWGVSGIPGMMNYYLRFNYQYLSTMTWGDLYLVGIPRQVTQVSDVQVLRLSGTSNAGPFTTGVVIHLGTPPDDTPDDDTDYPSGEDYDGTDPGPYNPEEQKPDFTSYERTGFSGKAVLTKTYCMDDLKLANVGSKLWTQSYFDVLKIQNNPIENVVSVKWFPFTQTGVNANIVVGNVDLELQAGVVDSLYEINIGSVKYTAKNPSAPTFLDYSPYTILKLHLPYVGIVQLDASECLNRTINVKYVIDLVTGDCIAYVFLDAGKMPFVSASGNCGVDIPLTAGNRVQSEMRAAGTAISAVTGAAAHVMSGDIAGGAVGAAESALTLAGMDYTTQRTSNHSPACATKENGAVFLEIWRPAFDLSQGFKQRHGWPCHKFVTLGTLQASQIDTDENRRSGFVKCDSRTKIDFALTSRENEMLESLLTDGVYLTAHNTEWQPIPD